MLLLLEKKYCLLLLEIAFPDIQSVSWLGEFITLVKCTAQKAMQRTQELVTGICKIRGYTVQETTELIHQLVEGRYNHDKPFVFEDLQGVIKNLHQGVPAEFRELFEAHCEKR